MSAEVVPFGKYKGQPVEVLAADHDYCEWLTAQPWFKARYLNVYNTVINYGAEPQDSPEHNQMQARFLDDAWCLGLAKSLRLNSPRDVSYRSFEQGWDVSFRVSHLVQTAHQEWTKQGMQWVHDDKPSRTGDTIDVELKPDLGDDYPAVLRQVKRYMQARDSYLGTACVLVRRHAFEGVTWEQVKEIFDASKIKLLAESEIVSYQPPSPEDSALALVKDRLGAEAIAESDLGNGAA